MKLAAPKDKQERKRDDEGGGKAYRDVDVVIVEDEGSVRVSELSGHCYLMF